MEAMGGDFSSDEKSVQQVGRFSLNSKQPYQQGRVAGSCHYVMVNVGLCWVGRLGESSPGVGFRLSGRFSLKHKARVLTGLHFPLSSVIHPMR